MEKESEQFDRLGLLQGKGEARVSKKGDVLVEVKDMCKNFGVTVALNHVNIVVRRGEILGLIGENGSGKSTVSSIIAGIQPATSGEMYFNNKPWKPATSVEAANHGIGMIVQEAGTIDAITVAENIFLGNYGMFKRGPSISRSRMNTEARKALDKVGITDIHPSMPARVYDMQERKLIEIAKVMYNDPEVLIIDETTTALSQNGRRLLYELMHKTADANKAVIFISHDLEELMEHCDTMTVLRDGVVIDSIPRAQFDANTIKHKMVGRELKGNYYRVDDDGYDPEVVLRADKMTTMKELLCFNMELHKGEILGVGGLSNCGMHELGRALYGLDEVVYGQVVLPGKGCTITSAESAFGHGLGYVSKNRDTESLEPNASIAANIQSTGYRKNRWFGPFISGRKEKRYAAEQVKSLSIKCVDMFQPVKAMSGGNKQKVVFGKWIADDADILILDCPTRGVDVGVKASMYQLIYEMKKKGKSIIMISEEMPELMGMSDRIIIMKDGRRSGEFYRQEGYNEHEMIECMI